MTPKTIYERTKIMKTSKLTVEEVFETADSTTKEVFEKADLLVSAGAQAKIMSRFFEKFGVDTPEDEALKKSSERMYHNAQKEYIKLFVDDDDQAAKIDALVYFYEQTERQVECAYKICEIFKKHKLPMYEKRLCNE